MVKGRSTPHVAMECATRSRWSSKPLDLALSSWSPSTLDPITDLRRKGACYLLSTSSLPFFAPKQPS